MATSTDQDMEQTATKLLPNLIDEIASSDPNAAYAEYPVDGASYEAGFKTLSYGQLANAINGTAHWLTQKLGPGQKCETVAYLGASDARYVFAFVGAIKAGYKVRGWHHLVHLWNILPSSCTDRQQLFLTSPRNSTAAHVSLLNDLDCDKLIITARAPPGVSEIQSSKEIEVLTIPSLDDLVEGTWAHFPYTKDFETGRHDGAFASHTSGSTGLPSPRVYTNDFIARAVRNILLPPPKGYQSLGAMTGRNKQLLLLPLFHPAGVQFGILNAIYNRTVIVLPSPSAPPSAEGLVGMMGYTQVDTAVMAPALLEGLAKDVVLLEEVTKHLKLLVFGGGSLPGPLGDVIASKIKLASFLGSSETAGYATIFPEDFDATRDWQYAQIHPATGVEFEQQVGDGFELVVKRSVIAEPFQPVFEVFPDLREYRTKDIFDRHPKWPDMWKHASRSDDIIVFLNGEKTNPVTFENEVSKDPEVRSAIVFGQQRFEAGLLVEPRDGAILSVQQRAALIERIWPTIEGANQHAPAHARISKDHILIVNPENPVDRTAKETIKRKATLIAYSEEINALYADAEKTWVGPTGVLSQRQNLADTVAVAEVIQARLKNIARLDALGLEEDFFARGVDSLAVLRLIRDLRGLFGVEQLQPGTVYLHPNAMSLAKTIHDISQESTLTKQDQEAQRRRRLTEVLNFHFQEIDQQACALHSCGNLNTKSGRASNATHAVVLIGSTGNIGSYLLRSLLIHEAVEHIYCLNRSPSSETKQLIHNTKSDATLPTYFSKDRVTFLEANICNARLGLANSDYEIIRKTAALIIYSAWPVNFNLPLSAFENQLTGVTNVCDFAVRAELAPKLLYLSSVAAAMGFNGTKNEIVKEEILEDLGAPAANGYAESKYVAERLLGRAAEKMRLDVRIARAGQVCGPARSKGAWKREEWLPSLVLGSRYLGALPESLGSYGPDDKDVDWVPVDVLADVIVEIGMGADSDAKAQVFHPFKQPALGWGNLVPAVLEAMKSSSSARGRWKDDMKVVSSAEWLAKLRASAATISADHGGHDKDMEAVLKENPAIRLLEFYQKKLGENSVLKWDTKNSERASQTLRQAKAISPSMMKGWVQDWVEG